MIKGPAQGGAGHGGDVLVEGTLDVRVAFGELLSLCRDHTIVARLPEFDQVVGRARRPSRDHILREIGPAIPQDRLFEAIVCKQLGRLGKALIRIGNSIIVVIRVEHVEQPISVRVCQRRVRVRLALNPSVHPSVHPSFHTSIRPGLYPGFHHRI